MVVCEHPDAVANRHFGKFGDVWKHLALSEVIAHERPRAYAETHAGSATYPMVQDDERRFGINHFLNAAPAQPALARCRYLELIVPFLQRREPLYPGSAAIAMSALGPETRYLLCDLDPASISTLQDWVCRLGAADATVVYGDGLEAVARWLTASDKIAAVVHIDPFDPDAQNTAGVSALTLAAQIIQSGQTLVYWYGYDEPAEAGWAYHTLRDLSGGRPMWCGDMMITDSAGSGNVGDLGVASTPGTGCGVILANVKAQTTPACQRLGTAVARAYTNTRLPSGDPGGIRFNQLGEL